MTTLLEEMRLETPQLLSLLESQNFFKDEIKARRSFSCACEKTHDDGMALFCLKWIISVKEEGFIEQANQNEEEVDEAKVNKFRAAGALSVFPEIPLCSYVVMPKTKEFVFSEIVRECYETDDEKWSDELFKFLCSIEFNCFNDEELLEKIIRKYTDSRFELSPSRFYRHILIAVLERKEWSKNKLNHPKSHIESMGQILFNAWRKTALKDFRDMARVVSIIQPLEGVSNQAFEHLAVCAKRIADIDINCKGATKYRISLDYEVTEQ